MKKTFKNFITSYPQIAKLAKAVRKQSGLSGDDFFDYLENVAASPCGAAGGFGGFIYYTETSEFYRKNRAAIKESLDEFAKSLGESVIKIVMGFSTFKDSPEFTEDEFGRALYGNYDDDLYYIYNALAWYALEEVANTYSDFAYECEE